MAKTETPEVRNCGTMEVHERLLRTDPSYARARVASENHHWQSLVGGFVTGRAGITVIPVVVHVVWKTNAQNISDQQIQTQIDVLNRDFRKTNGDIPSIPAAFAPLAADARIEFELATTDPQGNTTDGITRKKTTKDNFTNNNDVKSNSSGGVDAWPAGDYLNLWVCELAGTLLGYAQFPGGPANTDGVVIRHSAFGTTGTAAAPFNLGRTATHEIGHWLNLRHIWGDDGGGCNGDDFVADTPNCAGENTGKPAFPHVTCNNGPNGDMFMNYMDYTDDDSMFMFTLGQVDRMQACLDSDRTSIGHPKPGKLKFTDDPIGTLKFGDDPTLPTLKFRDDPIDTLKFRDDVATLKFGDDPSPTTLKFRDDPIGTFKAIDDPIGTSPIADLPGPGPGPGFPGPDPGPGPAPFVLSTPHHSMAWSQSFPGAFRQTLESIQAQLTAYEQQLTQIAQAQQAGQLSPQDASAADQLYAEYMRLTEEYRRLAGG